MAQFNEILEGGLNQALSRRLDMMGGAPAPVLAPEVIPTLALPVDPVELLYSAGWRRWFLANEVAAVAGQSARGRFRVLSDSGVLVVLEQITVSLGGASAINLTGSAATTDFGNVLDAYLWRDGHQYPQDGDAVLISVETNASTFNASGVRARGIANTDVQLLTSPIVLLPGLCIDIVATAQNIGVGFNWVWRTRRALSNELVG